MSRPAGRDGGSLTPRQVLLLFLLLALAAGLRFYHLDSPSEPVFDESHYVGAARVMAGIEQGDDRLPDPYYFHPPLGKLMIAAGVRLFDDDPFGWRVFVALSGVASIGLLFQIARVLFGSFSLAWFSAALYGLDFLQIIHSRVAMLDGFLAAPVLGGMLALLHLLERPRSRFWFGVAAVSWALALAVKTSALIYLGAFVLIYLVLSREAPWQRLLSLVAIVTAAVALFSLSSVFYLLHGYDFSEWLQLRWNATFNFASRAPSHPYESAPPMWLFNSRAIWYYFDDATGVGILGFGNPALWLAFLPALFLAFCRYREGRDRADLLLLLWFGFSYLPYFLILWHRGGFLYYMLPAVAPMTLMVARMLSQVANVRKIRALYLVGAAIVLLLFLPLVLGLPAPPWYRSMVATWLYS